MATIISPLAFGIDYQWNDVVANVMGVPLGTITAIEYAQEQDMMNNYGAGAYPVSRGFGKITPTAKITISMKELEAIVAVAPGGILQNIPEFDVIVTYVSVNNPVIVHTIRNCRFKNDGRTMKNSDTQFLVELTLLPSHIVFA